jgi:Zn finger protein HypA/HybF involved in hydrogenase expression
MKEDFPTLFQKGKLNGSQRNRVKRLLNMLYTPKELAEEIGISKQQIYRVYIAYGCPHCKDRRGRIWVNGEEFKAWIEETYKKHKLKPNQAYCVSCKQIVDIVEPEKVKKDNLIFYLSVCPLCSKRVARIIDCKRKKNDQPGKLEAR